MTSNFVVLFCVVSLATATPIAHVFLIIGQSNSIGYNSDGHTNEDITFPNILQTSCCQDGLCKIIIGDDPLHHQCDEGYLQSQDVGFGMAFARQLRMEIPEEDVIVLVPAGIGGYGFHDDAWTAYTGFGFKIALDRLRTTFDLLSNQYPQHNSSLEGFLWHQGEADAGVNTTVADYLNKDIIPMIHAWRDENLIPESGPTVPFVIGNLVPSWVMDVEETERLGVFVALELLQQYIPYTASTPSQGLRGDKSEGAKPIHFAASSQRIFGKRYHTAWKIAQSNFPDTSV